MPFGKYQGVLLEAAPADYLRWLTTRDLREPLASQVRDELQRRTRDHRSSTRRPAGDRASTRGPLAQRPALPLLEELVGAGVRTLAKRYHPDVGGTHEQMLALNHANEWLLAQLRRGSL